MSPGPPWARDRLHAEVGWGDVGGAGSWGGQHSPAPLALLCTAPDPITPLRWAIGAACVGGTGQPGVPVSVGSPGSCVAAAVTGFPLRAPQLLLGPGEALRVLRDPRCAPRGRGAEGGGGQCLARQRCLGREGEVR